MMNNLETIRQQNPLVVCYTNDVVKNFTANGLLSLGASPAMSEAPEEAEDFFKVASALLINIGTLNKLQSEDMLKIAHIANNSGVPIVFDPVAVGASQFRKSFCHQFLSEVDVTVIKGNASEILSLIDEDATMKGTDSAENLDVIDIARRAQKKFNTTIAITGKEDIIAQEDKIVKLSNGSQLLTKITGAGCLLGGVIASFLNRSLTPSIDNVIEAVSIFNIAAEQAESETASIGPGSFLTRFVDKLYTIEHSEYMQLKQLVEV
ncbi:hydroxyethylthiazole kinase [Helicobacter pylori]